MKFAPIILFACKRPDLTLNCLNCLKRNKEFEESLLFVYIDKTLEDIDKYLETIEIIKQNAPSNARIIISDVHQGSPIAIPKAITEVLNEFDKVIVIEDDLFLSNFFLKFMNDGLNKYQYDLNVGAIHGYLYPLDLLKYDKDTFFVHDPGSLGWGTWKRSWELFEKDASKSISYIKEHKLKKKFNNGYPFFKRLKKVKNKKIKCWDVKWRATFYIHDLLTLYPSHSLVRHDGNRPDATNHFTNKDWLYTNVYQKPIKVENIDVIDNVIIENQFKKFLYNNAGMRTIDKIKNKLTPKISIILFSVLLFISIFFLSKLPAIYLKENPLIGILIMFTIFVSSFFIFVNVDKIKNKS